MERSIKELFQVMLEHQELFTGGLCRWNTELYLKECFTINEHNNMYAYLNNNLPPEMENSYYCWEHGLIEPRIKWIKQQIKKLESC